MGRSYMLLISSPSMSLVVALLMMFVSDVLSQTELAPSYPVCTNITLGISDAEANAVKALYTGWGIFSATRGGECSDPCSCAWEGVICIKLVQPAVATGPCTTVYTTALLGL
jgi:hypothetical protein